MISIELEDIEYFDGSKNEFVTIPGGTFRFEYTLKVLYDWEGKWKKPFLKGELTGPELVDFYMRMALDPIDEEFMDVELMKTLSKYCGSSETATVFSTLQDGQNGNNLSKKPKLYTAEEIYALMFLNGIPLEWENRNLNRLLTTLRVIQAYQSPPKKMDQATILKQNADLNAQRKQQLKTKG